MYTSSQLGFSPTIAVDESDRTLVITKHWFDHGRLLQLAFALLLNGGAGFLIYQLADSIAHLLVVGAVAGSLVALFLQGTGLWMLYKAVCGLVNTTIIKVTDSAIFVQFKPLPWFGIKMISREQVMQLHVAEKDYSDLENNYVSYALQVVVRNNRPIFLLKGIESLEEARYLGEKIESFLFANSSQRTQDIVSA